MGSRDADQIPAGTDPTQSLGGGRQPMVRAPDIGCSPCSTANERSLVSEKTRYRATR